jgi:membrane protease YdiL (CAAX protease family)
MTRLIARHGTAVFLVLTYALSWPLWLMSGALGRPNIRTPDFPWLVAQVGVFAPAFAGMIVAAWSEAGAARRAWRTLVLVYLPAVVLGALIATRGFTSLAEIGPRWTAALVVFGAWVLCYFARGGNRLVPWPEAPARARTVVVWTVGGALAFAGCAWLSWLLAADGAASERIAGVAVSPFTVGAIVTSLAVNLLFGGSLGEELGWRGVWLSRLLRTRTPVEASLIISFWWALWHAPIDLTADPRS